MGRVKKKTRNINRNKTRNINRKKTRNINRKKTRNINRKKTRNINRKKTRNTRNVNNPKKFRYSGGMKVKLVPRDSPLLTGKERKESRRQIEEKIAAAMKNKEESIAAAARNKKEAAASAKGRAKVRENIEEHHTDPYGIIKILELAGKMGDKGFFAVDSKEKFKTLDKLYGVKDNSGVFKYKKLIEEFMRLEKENRDLSQGTLDLDEGSPSSSRDVSTPRTVVGRDGVSTPATVIDSDEYHLSPHQTKEELNSEIRKILDSGQLEMIESLKKRDSGQLEMIESLKKRNKQLTKQLEEHRMQTQKAFL